MSIGVEFLQLLTARGQLEISWLSTQMCVADLLTKILPKNLFQRHQGVLGFRRFEEVNSWTYEPEVQGICGALTINQMRDTALQGELNRVMAGCHKGIRYPGSLLASSRGTLVFVHDFVCVCFLFF